MKRGLTILTGGMLTAALVLSSGWAQVGSGGPSAPAEVKAPPDPAPDAPSPAEGAAPPEPGPPTLATVRVIAENIESDRGTVRLALCDSGLSVEGCPYHLSVPAAVGFVETTFKDIPPGTYAVVGYQDLNDNNEFDMLFGVPREPYALSGAAGDEFVPTFEDAAIPLAAGENDVRIRMRGIW